MKRYTFWFMHALHPPIVIRVNPLSRDLVAQLETTIQILPWWFPNLQFRVVLDVECDSASYFLGALDRVGVWPVCQPCCPYPLGHSWKRRKEGGESKEAVGGTELTKRYPCIPFQPHLCSWNTMRHLLISPLPSIKRKRRHTLPSAMVFCITLRELWSVIESCF